ncbi:hypothetical protein HYS72_03370 [Candidatus Pacearchaeota archaeon]|nr:hypothetical protein [Candidatus Pacearchaeota archaeon]
MAKRAIFLLIFAIFLISFASAEIIIHDQPNSVYNLGDTLTISATVKSLVSATDVLYMDLICEGQSINFYKNGISLSSGGEKKVEASLIFTKNLIGEIKGKCKVKGTFKGDYVLTNEFSVSDKITIIPESNNTIFTPGVPALIKGSALNENGDPANGFIDLKVVEGESSLLSKHDTINNGFFSINVIFPEDIKAGRYLLELSAYEEEPGEIVNEKTNLGFTAYNIDVTQVPTSLELILDKEVVPGTNAKIKTILHDQTGKNIDAAAKITIKDDEKKIIEQTEKATDNYLEIPIKYNQKSSVWEVSAEFNGLTAESTFFIQEKKDVNVSLVNNTLIITNVGNVPYDAPLTIKIGEQEVFVDTNLKVDESKKYSLTAPDGEYQISVLEEGGDVYTLSSFLTGRVIGAKEKRGIRGFFSFAWIFIILILGYAAYMFFKKQHKKSFFGFMPSSFAKKEKPMMMAGVELPLKNSSKLKSKSPLVVALSIKGDQQKTTAVCLHVKNLREIQKTKGDTEKILQRAIDFAEDNKAMTYENQDYLFFVLAPLKTKTFKNETTALKIAQGIKNSLTEQNRLFKQRINFGISINNGQIIIKKEGESAKFMSMGKFIGNSKRLTSFGEEIIFSKEVAEALKTEIKAEQIAGESDAYHIKEIKKYGTPENKKIRHS